MDLGAWALNAFAVKVNGTNGNGHINLRHQASDATSQGQSSTIFADNNGDLKWKNDGLSYATLKTSGITADRVYRFPDSTGTLALLTNIPTLTFSKNTGRDSIILTYNGTRSAVKDSTGGGVVLYSVPLQVQQVTILFPTQRTIKSGSGPTQQEQG